MSLASSSISYARKLVGSARNRWFGCDRPAAYPSPLCKPQCARTTRDASGQNDAAPYDLVRDTWRPTGGAAFEEWWRQALHDGVVAGSTPQALNIATPEVPDIKPFDGRGGFSLVLSPDPSAWDGRFANSPWLQECPKPVSKEVWGNALSIGVEDAKKLKLNSGDIVRLRIKDREVQTPVMVHSGCALGVVNLTLGYGRRHAGAIGSGVGTDAYGMRHSEAHLANRARDNCENRGTTGGSDHTELRTARGRRA